MQPEQAIPAQLRERRASTPQRRARGVMTHLHMDHASAISEFTSRDVRARARANGARSTRRGSTFNGYVRNHVEHAVEYREVPYDSPVIDSYSTFARSFDLFGDGSVRLVYTPGHTLGHQSLILRLKDREALVAGDAIYFLRTLEDEQRGFAMADEHQWRRSIARDPALPAREPGRADHPGARPGGVGAARPAVRVAGRPPASVRSPVIRRSMPSPTSARAASRSSACAISSRRLGERAEQQVGERLDRLLARSGPAPSGSAGRPGPAPARSAPRSRARPRGRARRARR